MTVEATVLKEPFRCSHCEFLGEISYSCLQRKQQSEPVKVWVKNLPDKISESGIKNLFLTVGKPLSITYNPKNNCALVLFEFMNEAELAVRDLHCQPPYNLKLKLVASEFYTENENSNKGSESTTNELWEFPHEEVLVKTEIGSHAENSEVVSQIANNRKNLGYDPSLRMRQKRLDFKTASECISMGRGYLFMGKNDRYIGGLEKLEITSENSKAKNKMSFSCQNCGSLTTKICGNCSASYCSKLCLNKSTIDHLTNCSVVRNRGVNQNLRSSNFAKVASNGPFTQVELTSGCTVVISTYITMKTVFVRCLDEHLEDMFAKVCNDVAAEAMKGNKLEKIPEEGDLVIAKYYEDLCFYRAQVSSNDNEKITLFFVDFGNTQETGFEDLKPLPDHLKAVPALAVKVHLKDVLEDSSIDSVNYYNKLTAERISLILNFENSLDEVVLIEKESKKIVNDTVIRDTLPSWKKDASVFSALGEIFYLNSIRPQSLEIGMTYNLSICHFEEKEFLESNVFWVTNPNTDDFFYVNSEMNLKLKDYCEFLKNDYYLPRINELCIAKEDGKWHRCVNLKSQKTICCLFFLDDGHSSSIDTSCIRKMIEDFTEAPAQAICCTLPDDWKLKTNKDLQLKIVNFFKESSGQTINSVGVLKLMGDAYCLSIPEINKILA